MNARRIAYWTVPSLLSLILYWPGITCWFQKDDFAWLGLYDMLHGWRDLPTILFAPFAQGTIRTLSERVMYTGFYALFGLNPLPFRIWAFATNVGILLMLSVVCVKLTGSRAAGFWAPILWTVNSAVAFALVWTAIYYQLLCALFFLVTFWLLLRYAETGERRFYIGQWATFLLGFGVLEINVVYPALALAYAVCRARRLIVPVLPMFLVSGLYTIAHTLAAPLPTSGPYKTYWDASVISTFWTYWKVALGPNRLIYLGIYPSFARSSLMIVLMAGLLGFLGWKIWRREWLAAFFAAWFVIVLAPILPLRDHITDSYLTVALIGPAMLAAWALDSGWCSGILGRVAAVALAAIYLCVAIPVARVNVVSFADRSHKIEGIVLSAANLGLAHPGQTILLKGVDEDMFWSAFFHRPLRLFGIADVYLVPEDRQSIAPDPQPDDVRRRFLPASEVKDLLDQKRALVVDVGSGQARDITTEYRRGHT